jgi:hypothetical protein
MSRLLAVLTIFVIALSSEMIEAGDDDDFKDSKKAKDTKKSTPTKHSCVLIPQPFKDAKKAKGDDDDDAKGSKKSY